jgi:hypothetical protein
VTAIDPTTRGRDGVFRSGLEEDRAVVAAWVSSCLDDVDVGDAIDGDGDDVVLLVEEVAPVEDRRPDRELPVRIRVTYVVVPPPGTGGAAQAVRVLVAAREVVDIEVLDESPTSDWWLARGLVPRPVVRLRTLLVIERPEVELARRVTEPLVVEISPSGPLRGVVVDETGRPLAGATVRLLSTGALCDTDRRGAFEFASVGLARLHHITVVARGTTYAGTVPAGAPRDLQIHCTPESM